MKRSLFWDDVIPKFDGVEEIVVDSQAYAKVIIRSLCQFTIPITESHILTETKGRTKELANALRELVRVGKVTRTGLGKKGAPYKYQVIY